MESEGSLPCLQGSAICPWPDPDNISSYLTHVISVRSLAVHLYKINFNRLCRYLVLKILKPTLEHGCRRTDIVTFVWSGENMTIVFNVIRTKNNGAGRLGVGWGVQHLPPSLNGLNKLELNKKMHKQSLQELYHTRQLFKIICFEYKSAKQLPQQNT